MIELTAAHGSLREMGISPGGSLYLEAAMAQTSGQLDGIELRHFKKNPTPLLAPPPHCENAIRQRAQGVIRSSGRTRVSCGRCLSAVG